VGEADARVAQALKDEIARDELLYWAFEGTTSGMASRWAAGHPRDGEEFRVTMWARQFALLNTLNPTWARRRRDALIDYLRRAQPESLSLIPASPRPDGTRQY